MFSSFKKLQQTFVVMSLCHQFYDTLTCASCHCLESNMVLAWQIRSLYLKWSGFFHSFFNPFSICFSIRCLKRKLRTVLLLSEYTGYQRLYHQTLWEAWKAKRSTAPCFVVPVATAQGKLSRQRDNKRKNFQYFWRRLYLSDFELSNKDRYMYLYWLRVIIFVSECLCFWGTWMKKMNIFQCYNCFSVSN